MTYSSRGQFLTTLHVVGPSFTQGCQMVCFQTKSPNLGKFWRAFAWQMLEYFMTIWNILWPFGIVGGNLLYFYQFGMFRPRKIWQPWFHLGMNLAPGVKFVT
jgi:hypothetical protein